MILRNKRPRSMLYISGGFMLYGLTLYSSDFLDNPLMLSMAGLILPAMFAMNHGQYLFSWDSSFFDSYLVNRVSPHSYIKSKYVFLLISCVIGYLLTLPYALFSYEIAFINGAMLLYNIGISLIFLIYLCTSNTSYIDLGKSQFMNYQGAGITQFLILVPIMGIPILIYILYKILGILPYYFYTLALIGVVGIIFNKYLLTLIVNRFKGRKYRMAVGFRQK